MDKSIFSNSVLILLILVPLIILVSYAENFDVEKNNDKVIDIKRAEKLIELGNYYGLLSYTQELSRNYPDDVNVLFYRGVGLWGLNIHLKSISYQDRVLEINPEHKLALYYKSDSLYQLERYDESLQVIEQALRIDPNFKKGIIQKEKILSEQNQTLLTPNIPSASELLTRKATLLARAGDFQGAHRFIDKAIVLDPYNVNALNDKGWILLLEEKPDEALIWFEKVLVMKPNMPYSLYNKGLVLFNQGELEQALVFFEKTLENDPNYEGAKTMKILTMKQLKDTSRQESSPVIPINHFDWFEHYSNWWFLDYVIVGIVIIMMGSLLKKRLNPI